MAHFFNKSKFHSLKYTKNSLFKHYLKGLISILLVPFILFYAILFVFNLRSTEDAFRYTSTEVLARSVTTMDNMFEVIYKNFETLNSNTTVQLFMLDDFFSYETGHQTYLYSKDISFQLQNICTSLNYIDSIHIYSKANNYFFSSVNSGSADKFYDPDCIGLYNSCNSNSLMLSRSNNDVPLFTICYIVNKGKDNEGAFFFNINAKKLTSILVDNDTFQGTLILNTKTGDTVFASGDTANITLPDLHLNSYRNYNINKTDDYVYMSTKLNYSDLTLSYVVSKRIYYTTFYPLMTNSIMFLIFTVLSLLLLSVVGTFKLYNSISSAFAYIEMPSSDTNNYGEFVFLTENMMSQVEGTPKAEATLADKIQKLKKYQALALQTQINPHFLFNSLNLISSYALESGKEDSPLVIIIDKLSDILRFCLNTKNYIIKIEEELKATQKYIEIENIKYDYSIDFLFEIDDEIYNYYTLKMILQPIIENAITHGVKLLRHEKGFVKISGKIINKKIVFSIINNGPEIPPEKLKMLQESLVSVSDIPENNHIGLRNVNQRMKLIFGDKYGCTIDSADSNTIVTVTIPTIAKNHDDFER